MKVRSAHALHPLSLATLALFRGSMALGHAYRRIARAPCFTIALVNSHNSRVASSCTAATPSATPSSAASAGSNVDRGKARRWNIPWGNPDGQVEDGKLVRTLETLPGTEDVEGSDSFRVMSFNMLAQSMASSKMFAYVPKGQLRKNVRWPRVRDEISRYGADIICLQECDKFDKILSSLKDKDQSQGTRFEGVYKRRKGKKDGHGVAVIFDSKGVGSFVMLEDRRRHLRPSDAENAQPLSDNAHIKTRGKRGDGGEEGGSAAETIVEQGEAASSGVVCVATTHLYWHPDGASIRLAQAEFFVARLEAFLRKRFGDSCHSVPIVIAGDLNNVPGVDVHTLLSTGACDGGTPKAFMRRRLLRAAARRAEKLEQLRAANRNATNRDAATMAAENADVCLLKTTEASDINGSTIEGNTARTPEEETCAGTVRTDEMPMALSTADARGATARATASATSLPVRTSRPSALIEGVPRQETISDAARGIEGATQAASTHRQSTDGRSTTATPDGQKDGDVRQYKQAFRGFSSAYGDYSSIFGSQLPRYPSDQESVCETTGQRLVGHVQLGVRDGRNGICRSKDNFVARERGEMAQLEELSTQPEELSRDRSEGEPQLTTCTDKFAGTIDYIWHTRQLRVRSLLGLPSLEQVMQGGGLPTTSYPSDHMSIMAELQWRRPAGDRDALPIEQRILDH